MFTARAILARNSNFLISLDSATTRQTSRQAMSKAHFEFRARIAWGVSWVVRERQEPQSGIHSP